MGCFGGDSGGYQAAPTTPAPSAEESAADIYQAKLKYDPLVAQQEMDIQKQMLPQQTELYSALYNQYYPQLAQQQQALQQQLYPQQSKILEAGAGNVLQALTSPAQQQLAQGINQQTLAQLQNPQTQLSQVMEQQALSGLQDQNALLGIAGGQAISGINPTELQQRLEQEALSGLTQTGYTPEQQAAIDAIRQRQAEGLSRQLRERSNLGGTLYGGRSQQLESQGLQELAQRYSAEDIDRMIAQKNQAMQQALSVQGAGLDQRQAALSGLLSTAGMQDQSRQQALAGAQGVSGLQMQQNQQALQNAMALQQYQQQAINPYLQILYPQIGTQQPNITPYQYQSAVPTGDTLYNAMFQASQPNYIYQQPQTSPIWGLLGSVGGGLAGGWAYNNL